MKLLSIIALSGDKSAALAAAQDEVRTNAVQVILHGNRRNFGDTAEALRAAGAVTKAGDYASNTRGDVLAALIQAEGAALSAQANIRPVMKGKATPAETAMAETAAQAISDAFGDAVVTARETRVASRKAKLAERKGAKQAEAAPEAAPGAGEGEGVGEGAPNTIGADELKGLMTKAGEAEKLRAMVSSLADERDALREERDALTEERDALRVELDALRAASMPAKPRRASKRAEALAAAA